MNGAHDLGGMTTFGPVLPEPDEPVFHADWERRVLALVLAMGATGAWNLDMSRQARESLPPPQYLTSSYYQIWLEGLLRLLQERGLVTEAEVREGRMAVPALPVRRTLKAADVARALAAGGPTLREPRGPALFKAGDRVRARNLNPQSHTRLPRYLRGRRGEVVALRGVHVYPDSNALGAGEDPQWLYTVRFTARELWGADRNAADSVHADLWEPYLAPA